MEDLPDPLVKGLQHEIAFPLHTFPVQDVFVWRHEQGTLIELQNEELALKQLNNKRLPFKAWAVAPIPRYTTAFAKSWLLLVQTPKSTERTAFPTLTERFRVDMETKVEREDGLFSLVHLPSSRIPNPYEDVESLRGSLIQKCAAFKVDVPRSWQKDDGDSIELDLMATFQIAPAIDDFPGIVLEERTHQIITLRWDVSPLTFEAELAALRFLVEEKRCSDREPSIKSKKAFRMIQDFHGTWKDFYSLQDEFPHLKDPTKTFHKVPKLLVEKFKEFNKDHRAAYEGLARIPNGLYFVNGCPGAGKTQWNLTLAALIQCKPRPRSKRRRSPILFLVDINKTVDDAADRYFRLCKDAGLNLRIIRMHGWPYEMHNSDRLNKMGQSENSKDTQLDFTKKFLTTANLARYTSIERNSQKAPTLDEAAWEYYQLHQNDCFSGLKKLLVRMDTGEAFSTADWRTLRSLVAVLYRAVLAQTDFVATTPVAAYGSFSQLFRPDVVFIDEAPHARELTTLIPIAYFEPIAWIFTGDVNQTRPFVKNENKTHADRENTRVNPFCEQLRLSTMARAAKVGALNSHLLVNKRAFGNLHRLPSKLFYDGLMTSGHSELQQFPPSTLHLKMWLENLGNGHTITENRVIISMKESCEESSRRSFWNPVHHRWLLEQVQHLLQDENFRSIADTAQAGTIMIQTPYSAAVAQYHGAVKQWRQEWQDRVQVMTVDKAQGSESDVVYLDLVRTTTVGFMDDRHRLNVGITRARQAEIILMHPMMTSRQCGKGRRRRTVYTSQMWDDAVAASRVFSIPQEEDDV